MDNNSIVLSSASDLYDLCEKRAEPVFSKFYDEAEQAILKDNGLLQPSAMMFGGHAECERKILGVFPEWEETDTEAYPIGIIKISHTFKKELSHRDYLGSLMGLGIERDRTGDILVYEDFAYVFVHDSVKSYILNNLKKIGSMGVKVSEEKLSGFVYPERRTQALNVVAASLRLDAVVSASLNISRNDASSLISHERVSVNHRLRTDLSKKLSEGDLISVRGFGRYLVSSVGDETRKGRLHITVLKYL